MNKIWFPLQRAIRTAVQVVVAAAAILATTVVIAPQILAAIQDVLPGPVVAWIAGAIAVLAALSAAIARVMAIPAVDEWLRNIGAGSAPAKAIVTQINGSDTGLTRRQWRALLDGADTGTDDTVRLRSAIGDHYNRIGL
jgi:hypothetical protein